ncbi:MAG: hypothetical protein VYE22_29445 [Myxococcota bacterium]|nr:hypothetical protein [Myxococcota bacterium]
MSETLGEAIDAGDLAAVERALEAGASALRAEDGTAPLRRAHAAGPAMVARLKRAAREESAETRPGLAREAAGGSLDALWVEAEVKATARALGELVQAPRREADVAARPIEDAHRLAFVVGPKGSRWSAVPVGVDAPWRLESVPELEARGDGLEPLTRALASRVGARALLVRDEAFTVYEPGGGVTRRTFDEPSWEAEDPGSPAARRDAALAEMGVSLFRANVRSDGLRVQLTTDADVARVDLVVLQELGDPSVDRRLSAVSAPAPVGPAGQPALVNAPPPRVTPDEPAPSDEAPMQREAPPMAPPLQGHAPPPLVDSPSAKPPPPMVGERGDEG